MEYYLPVMNVLYSMFEHPIVQETPRVMIGNKENIG